MAEETPLDAVEGLVLPRSPAPPVPPAVPTEPAERGEGAPSGAEARAESEEEHLLEAFRRQLIEMHSMGPEQRRLTVFALMLFTVIGLLLVTSALPQPLVQAGVSNLGAPLQVPAAVFVFSALALVVSWVLVLSGAMRSVWYIRFPVVGAGVLVLGTMPFTDLSVTLSAPGGWSFGRTVEAALRLGQIVVVLAFAAWAVRTTLAHRRRERQHAGAQPDMEADTLSTAWPTRTMTVTVWLLVNYYAVELIIWLINQGPAAGYVSRAVAADLGYQANALLLFLDVVVFWAATDLAEWGTKVPSALLGRVKRLIPYPWALWALTVAAGLAVLLIHVQSDQMSELLIHLLYLVVVAALVLLLVRFARLGSPLPGEIPVSAPPLGAAFAFGLFSLAVAGGVLLSRAAGQPVGAPAEEVFQSMLGVLCVLLALVAGVLLVARGRLRGRNATSLAGIFVFVVGLVLLSLALPDFLERTGITWFASGLFTFGAVQVAAALVALVSAGWYLARRKTHVEALSPVVASLVLLGGTEALDLLLNGILPAFARLGSLSITATAGLFLLGVYWDVWTSGGGTNGHTQAFPRSVRLLLYFGYTLFAAITLLYTSAERVAGTNQPVVATGPTGEIGLIALGVPFVWMVYGLRFGAWRFASVSPTEPASAPLTQRAKGIRLNPIWAARVVAGAGMVAGVVVVAVTVFGLVPHVLVHPSNHAYSATAPGSVCDRGGGQWNEIGAITLACTARQTKVVVGAKGQGEMEFLLPDGAALPERFQMGLRVALTGLPTGCAGLYTATEAQLFILGNICSDGHFSLVTSSPTLTPVIGNLKPGTSHTITLGAGPTSIRLAVDGATVGTLALPNRASFQQLGITVSNIDAAPGSALLSDFTYAPEA